MKDTRENMNNTPARPLLAKGGAALALAAMLIAGTASCKKNKDVASPTTGALGFKATVESHLSDGKTYLDVNQVKWIEGDRVAVYNGDGEYGKLKAVNVSSDFKSAELRDITNDYHFVGPYKAVYPCPGSDAPVTGNVVEGVPLHPDGKQQYSPNGFPTDVNPMAAYAQAANATELNFQNLCGILKISIKGNFTAKSISIESNNQEDILWGTCSVSFSESDCKITNVANNNDKKHILTMDCNVTLKQDKATDFYFVLPPDMLESGYTMKVFDANDLAAGRRKASHGTKVEKNKITSMKEFTLMQAENLAGSGNLEKANCYIADKRGHDYMFPCNVKGNGVPPVTGSPCLTYLSPEQQMSGLFSYETADLVWQTYNDATEHPSDVVKNVTLEGDYVHFTTGDNEGNALIAVRNSQDEIIWSWHIWCVNPENKPNEAFELNEYTLMDRNLGALSNDQTFKTAGLLYQWGRKDPLFGASNFHTINNSTYMNSVTNLAIAASNDEISNLKQSINHPDMFCIKNSNTSDWFSNTVNNNEEYRGNGLWDVTKTMFDPCPYGWRVPEIGTLDVSEENGTTNIIVNNSPWGNLTGEDSNWKEFNNEGKIFTNGTEEIYYPAAGYRNVNGGLGNVGKIGYGWSCTPAHVSSSNRNHVYYLRYNNSNEIIFNALDRGSAYCVRPVKYQEQPTAPSGK